MLLSTNPKKYKTKMSRSIYSVIFKINRLSNKKNVNSSPFRRIYLGGKSFIIDEDGNEIADSEDINICSNTSASSAVKDNKIDVSEAREDSVESEDVKKDDLSTTSCSKKLVHQEN